MKNDNTSNYKKQYDSITALYTMLDELASTAEAKTVKKPDEHFSVIEPLIEDIADSTDVISEEYINVLENPTRKKAAKLKIEKALRKVFLALEEYRLRLEDAGKDVIASLAVTAESIVEKIVKQIQKITLIFLQLMDISLERIMHKHELDAFKRMNARFFDGLPQHMH